MKGVPILLGFTIIAPTAQPAPGQIHMTTKTPPIDPAAQTVTGSPF